MEEPEQLRTPTKELLAIENLRIGTSIPEEMVDPHLLLLIDVVQVGSGKESLLQIVTTKAGAHRFKAFLELWCQDNPLQD